MNIPKENTGGDCYEAAVNFIIGKRTEGYKVVHGYVTGQGAIEGIRYDHAWVEDDENVYDYSCGRELCIPKFLYYLLGKVEESETFKYTNREVSTMITDLGVYGPWDLEPKAEDLYAARGEYDFT